MNGLHLIRLIFTIVCKHCMVKLLHVHAQHMEIIAPHLWNKHKWKRDARNDHDYYRSVSLLRWVFGIPNSLLNVNPSLIDVHALSRSFSSTIKSLFTKFAIIASVFSYCVPLSAECRDSILMSVLALSWVPWLFASGCVLGHKIRAPEYLPKKELCN